MTRIAHTPPAIGNPHGMFKRAKGVNIVNSTIVNGDITTGGEQKCVSLLVTERTILDTEKFFLVASFENFVFTSL